MGFFDAFNPLKMFQSDGLFDSLGLGSLIGIPQGQAAYSGANAMNNAAMQFSNQQNEANALGLSRAYSMLFGDDFLSKLAPGLNEQQLKAVQDAQARAGALPGGGSSMGGGLLGQYQQLGQTAGQNTQRLQSSVQSALMGYNPVETARQFGAGREAQIREDAGRDLESRNAMTRSALAGSGLSNSTALANQFAGNANDVTRARDRSLTDLNMASTDRVMAAQNAQGQRAMQGVGMLERSLGNEQAYRQQPLDIQRMLMMSAMNPGAVQPMSAGVSPSGSQNLAQAQALQSLFGMGASFLPLAFLG